jgi:murein DD-endopeptidase MepM/ murein hydrolase activator NlpD
MRARTFITFVAIALDLIAVAAQQSAPRPRPPVSTPARAQAQASPEAEALRITITARALQPGEVVRLDVQSDRPIANLTARAFGNPLPMTPVGDGRWRALLGLDLDVTAGTHDIVFDLRDGAGGHTTQTKTLTVEAKSFPTRTLKVDPRFVQPPPAAQRRIERDRVRLAAVFAKSAPMPLWDRPFVMPVKSSVISSFGVRSVFNGELRAPHGGADLASPTGTPIHAPNAGRIVLAGDLYFTGNTVVIDHGAGLYSLLAHLSKIAVREGDPIERGALVGNVGATGRVTGPHLHWTVRLGTARVDPVSLIYVLESLGE